MDMTMSDTPKRFGIFYDEDMLENERLVKLTLKRKGVKATRSNIVRFLLGQEAERIRKSEKKP